MIDLKTFKTNLARTQQYCEQQLLQTGKHFADILRSINPPYGDGNAPLFTYSFWSSPNHPGYNGYITEWQENPIDSIHLIEWLFDIQHNIKQQQPSQITDVPSGCILVFHVDDTLWHGAARVETAGFIDDYNFPPVDTWFYLHKDASSESVLFAWIPEPFVHAVDNGIAVNPEGCIKWMDV